MDNPTSAPKFRKNQVVYWGNGKHEFVRISDVLALHCEGAAQSYRVARFASNAREFTSQITEGPVSEAVLRPLTAEEIGI